MIRQLLILALCFVAIQSMGVPMGAHCDDSKCPAGYTEFHRVNGKWCIKIFPGNMTWWEAERECRCSTKGAHLSGIENNEEKRWVEDEAQKMFENETIKNGAIWIGAYRRKECPSGTESSAVVCDKETLFQFTDHHACKTDIFRNWADNQPTNKAGDDCAVIQVSTEQANEDASGKTATKNCLQSNGPTPLLSSAGYICGVKPYPGGGHNYGGGYDNGYGGGEGMIIIGAGKPAKKH